MNTPKTAFEYGYKLAQFMVSVHEVDSEPVDIDQLIHGTTSIPPEDYRSMVNANIEPDAEQYWQGYNTYMVSLKAAL